MLNPNFIAKCLSYFPLYSFNLNHDSFLFFNKLDDDEISRAHKVSGDSILT